MRLSTSLTRNKESRLSVLQYGLFFAGQAGDPTDAVDDPVGDAGERVDPGYDIRAVRGRETLEETAAVARKLGGYHVQVILDYGVEGGDEGEAGF